jgi:hypothetical protein
MRPFYIFIATIITLAGTSACSKPQPTLEGFNSELWKKDKKGCDGKRSYFAEILLAKSTEIKGMDDDDVAELLGKPEKSSWEDRGKKTYIYYIQPGKQCDTSFILEGIKLAIEFDALGRVKLVTEQKY